MLLELVESCNVLLILKILRNSLVDYIPVRHAQCLEPRTLSHGVKHSYSSGGDGQRRYDVASKRENIYHRYIDI